MWLETLELVLLPVLMNNTLACYEIVHQSGGNAEDPHKQIADGKVQDEDISDRPHVPFPQDYETHHTVTYHAKQEDEQVGQDEHGSHAQWVLEVWRK